MFEEDLKGQEELEAQLKETLPEPELEPEPESSPESESETPPETPQISREELEQRLAKLEEEVANKSAAISDERERRKTSDMQFNALIEQLRQAQARQVEQQRPPEPEFSEEDQEIINFVNRTVGQRLQTIEEAMGQMVGYQTHQFQRQQQAMHYMQLEAEYSKENPDYNNAVNYLLGVVGTMAQQAFPNDPVRQQQYVEGQRFNAMTYRPEVIYDWAKKMGYQTSTSETAPETSSGTVPPQPPKPPKSLADIPGSKGALPDSLEAKRDKINNMSMEEIMKLPAEEIDKVLKGLNIPIPGYSQ